jgi:hypothetical protein
MFKQIQIVFLISVIFSIFLPRSFSQNTPDISSPHLMTQNNYAEQNLIGSKYQTDISISLNTKHRYSAISGDGNTIVSNGNIVRWNGNRYTKEKLLVSNFRGEIQKLDHSGQFLAYVEQSGTEASIHLVHTNNGKSIFKHTFTKKYPYERIIHFDMSSNAQVFACSYYYGSGIEKIYIIERNGKNSTVSVLADNLELINDFFLSNNGDKIYYNAVTRKIIDRNGKPASINDYGCHGIEKSQNKWNTPKRLTKYDIGSPFIEDVTTPVADVSTSIIKDVSDPLIVDTAQNGDQLLIHTGKRGLALIDKGSNRWSIQDWLHYVPKRSDRITMSEEGKTIVIAQKISTQSALRDSIAKYNIYIYNRTNNGKWKQTKLNESDLFSDGEYLLSKSGNRIFWRQTE